MLRHILSSNDGDMNNFINAGAVASPMDPFQWAQFPSNSSVAGTSELFSSTFAMLSGDAAAPFQEWPDQKPNVSSMPAGLFFDPSSHQSAAPIVPGLYDPPMDTSTMARFDPPAVHQFRSMYDAAPSLAPPPFMLPSTYSQSQFTLPSQHLLMPHTSHHTIPQQPQIKQEFSMAPMGQPPMARPSAQLPTPHPLPISTSNPLLASTPQRNSTPRRPSSSSCSTAPAPAPSASSSVMSPSVAEMLSPSNRDADSSNGGSPHTSEAISTDLEGPDNVRVMCLACKGVYPSRRSLTGHIGRNEKCREIIESGSVSAVSSRAGRNYLDQVAAGANPVQPGTESALKAGALTNGQDGMSPVCPYCDRFISHYKGNIRRHINQCGKNTSGQRRPRTDKMGGQDKERKRGRKRVDDGPPPILHEGFEPASPMSSLNQPMTSFLPSMGDDGHSGEQSSAHSLPSDPSPPNAPKKEADPPEDAYICGQCEFVTIYKGNMKRHLNTCHPAPDCKDLKEWDRKLESMRASALGISREEMLERLQQHKMNSTRGRKPRSKGAGGGQGGRADRDNTQEGMMGTVGLHVQQQHQMQHQMMLPPQDYNPPQMHYSYDMSGYL